MSLSHLVRKKITTQRPMRMMKIGIDAIINKKNLDETFFFVVLRVIFENSSLP